MLYIESPVGVGFSYSDNSADYNTNDNKTAADNYLFLQLWFKEFPQFTENEFWITGESYAGVYGPMLANLIVNGAQSTLKSNFQGFALGNPVTSCPALKRHDMDIQLNTYYWNGLLSLRFVRQWEAKGCPDREDSPTCRAIYKQVQQAVEPISASDLYLNACTGNGTLDAFAQTPGCITMSTLTTNYLNVRTPASQNSGITFL